MIAGFLNFVIFKLPGNREYEGNA